MIKIPYYENHNVTVYACDRCKKTLDGKENKRVRLVCQHDTNRGAKTFNSWDLCEKCYAALDRGIKAGIKPRKENKNEGSKKNTKVLK